MSCGVGRRHGLDLTLLWLWHRPVATAPIRPLAWEPPYAVGVAPKKQQKRENSTSTHEGTGLIPGLAQCVKTSGVAVSCGVGCRGSSDLVLPWLWCRQAGAAPVQPPALERSYAAGVALKRKKKKKLGNG